MVEAVPQAERPAKLVTVHGTGSGLLEDAGENWWQNDGSFQKELSRLLSFDAARVDYVPFHWNEGPNSESARREASRELYAKLRQYDRDGHDYCLLAHSHGGSVIYNALLESVVRRKPLQRLKCWCTVGTPFLDYRPHRFLFRRVTLFGKSLFVLALAVLIFTILLAGYPYVYGINRQEDVEALLGAYGSRRYVVFLLGLVAYATIAILILIFVDKRLGGWRTRRQKERVRRLYEGSWLGLWHRDDEAISALSNVKGLKGPIIPSAFLVPVFSTVPLLLMVPLVLFFLWDPLGTIEALPPWMQPLTFWKQMTQGMSEFGKLASMTGLSFVIVCVFFALIALGIQVFERLALWIGSPMARAIDRLVWASVRQRAWGDDKSREGVDGISPYPPLFERRFAPLPDAVGAELSAYSDKHAITTLKKVRELLGMSANPQAAHDVRAELGKTLSWRELIHTSYFDVPACARILAYGLNRAGLGQLSAEHWPEATRTETEAWLRHISTPPPAAATAGEGAPAPIGAVAGAPVGRMQEA